MSIIPPKVFVSYSHDSEVHKDWVLQLATRLVSNGVNIILDQWDLTLGSNLPKFMEEGLTSARRVMAICTEKYVQKANKGNGGVGYEKGILTEQLMRDTDSDRIIPIIRQNTLIPPVPTFLFSRVYLDFRDEFSYEARYAELLRDIHNQQIKPRPPIGQNPFAIHSGSSEPLLSSRPERYVTPSLSGSVTFDYSNNNGRYVLGAGDMAFETAWSRGGNSEIHAYTDGPNIQSIALVDDASEIEKVLDGSKYDYSSRVRTPRVGDIVIWKNVSGYFLATKIEQLNARGHGSTFDEISFSFKIAPNKTSFFAK